MQFLKDTAPNPDEYQKELSANNGDYYKTSKEFFKQHLQGKAVIGDVDGEKCPVFFTGGTWREVKMGLKNDPIKCAAFPFLADIVSSVPGVKESLYHERKDGTKEVVTFTKPIKTSAGIKDVFVDALVRERATPDPSVYSFSVEGSHEFFYRKNKKAEPPADPGKSPGGGGSKPAEDADFSLASDAERLSQKIAKEYEVVNIRIKGQDMPNETIFALDAAMSHRHTDENGFMHVSSSHLTKEQVVPYRGVEIPRWQEAGLDPNKIYYGYRPAEEIEKAAHTFNGLPIMLLHHSISAHNPKKQYQVGSLGTNATWNAPYLDNSLIFTDAVGINAIENGNCKELSMAYQYDPDFTPGEFEGTHYDFVMRNLRGNHCAVVPDGRAGPDVVVADSAENVKPSGGKTFMNKLINLLRGAQDADPVIEKQEVGLAQGILDLHKKDPATGEIKDVTEDEDKNAKIDEILKSFADVWSAEELSKLKNTLTDLAYSKATGSREIARKMDGEDSDPLNTAEAYAYGEKKEREREERGEMPDGKDAGALNTAEAIAAGENHERDKLMREHMRKRAEDAMKACGMDAETDEVKDAFARGFAYGMHDGEKDMRNEAKRRKLDREGMEKHLAHDSAALVRQLEKVLEAKFEAAEEVKKVVGLIRPLAFDSADSIYQAALAQMGKTDVPKTSARDVFRAIVGTYQRTLAMDAALVQQAKYTGAFAGLNNITVER